MTLNQTGRRLCDICSAGLSDSDLVTLPTISVNSEKSNGHDAVEPGVPITHDLWGPHEEIYIRCTSCMSLNALDQQNCAYCGSELSNSHRVTMLFSPGSIGKLATEHSSEVGEKDESPSKSAAKFNDWQYGLIEYAIILAASSLLSFPLKITPRTFLFLLIVIFMISIFNAVVFAFLNSWDSSLPMGRDGQLKWGIIWFVVLMPVDLIVYAFVFTLVVPVLQH